MTGETKTCQNCKQSFVIESEDYAFYERIQVPPPTFCPDCRLQRRLLTRNERVLYKRNCDLCGVTFISTYSPEKPFKVYCRECWLSDKWSPLDYGVDYDFRRPFFEQYRELMEKVPRIGIMHYHTNLNCDYANFVAGDKNVYLSYSVTDSEDVYYSRFIDKSKNCLDSFNLEESEIVYENTDGDRNHRTSFLFRSRECIESSFLFDCSNCQNCFMSSNLRNKRFVFRNRQLGKEEYQAELENVNLGSFRELSALRQEFVQLNRASLHKYGNLIKTTNCSGNNIENSKNAKYSFDVYDSENLKYCSRIINTKDSYDVFGCAPSELMYEYVAGGFGSYKAMFSVFGDNTRESLYTDWCHGSSNMFGCVGIRKKEYCVLNKQYTREEYVELVPRVIEHMNAAPYHGKNGRSYKFGEFFPAEIAPYAYNETITQEYFPLSKDEALAKGFGWRDPDPYPHTPTMRSEDLPDDVKDTPNDITKEIIACNSCGRAYRIVEAELEFLKSSGIALPRKCENCRYQDRFRLRTPLHLWHRKCRCAGVGHFHDQSRCPNEFETSYPPDSPFIVYCEQCYQAEVV